MIRIKKSLSICAWLLLVSGVCKAQFMDAFDKKELEGWFFFTGDGYATMEFVQQEEGYATLYIDATRDPHNLWYAITKRDVSPYLNLKKLKSPDHELRVEARVRSHQAPRRVNFMVNTQRTTDYHHDLMEFELPDTNWHVISMTTKALDAVPGDSLFVQFNVTDFGWEKYQVDIDYLKADIINMKKAGPDKGIQVPYHPPVPASGTFSHHVAVAQDALINPDYPEVNLNNWHVQEKEGIARVLTVFGKQWALLKWELEDFKDQEADGAGLLEITTQSVAAGGNYTEAYGEQFGEEFPRLRVIEIFGGDPDWEQEQVTYHNFMQELSYEEVFNPQMIFDIALAEQAGAQNFITISAPVMQRLLDGTTKGLLIRPLGAISASFYASENRAGMGPKLHFNSR